MHPDATRGSLAERPASDQARDGQRRLEEPLTTQCSIMPSYTPHTGLPLSMREWAGVATGVDGPRG